MEIIIMVVVVMMSGRLKVMVVVVVISVIVVIGLNNMIVSAYIMMEVTRSWRWWTVKGVKDSENNVDNDSGNDNGEIEMIDWGWCREVHFMIRKNNLAFKNICVSHCHVRIKFI